MKYNKTLLGLFIFAILILGIATVMPQRSAYAICYDSKKNPIPCPVNNPGKSDYSKKNQATDVPPTSTVQPPSATPKPTDAASIILQVSCPSPMQALTKSPAPTQPSNGTPSYPWFLGGAGLILGLIVGFFTGGVRGRRNLNENEIEGATFGKDNSFKDLERNPAFAQAVEDINQSIKKNEAIMNEETNIAKADRNAGDELLADASKLEKDANSLEHPVVNDNKKNGKGKNPT